jgi:Ca-activated chloride channel homolog
MRHPNNTLASALFATALACAAGPLCAQTPESTGTVIRTDVRLVVLHTTVVDKSGHHVMDLAQKAFKVYENGVPQEIKKFKREDVPVSLGLVIDNSGSMKEKRPRVAAAALALVKDSNPEDESFVVNFNDDAFLDLPPGEEFTSNMKDMEEALTRIDARGGTALYDSIRMSIDHLKNKGRRDKKVLVVVTDGADNQSVISIEALVKLAQQSEVLIYAVGLLGAEERREAAKARRALKELTTATGGEAFFPEELSEVDRIAHQVARDIRSQYIIQYTPSNAAMDGTYRQIKVAVNAPGHPAVRTRTGYYATDSHPEAAAAGSSFKQQ